jgi:hypothetical protein
MDRAMREKFENVFSEIEDMFDFHSRTVPQKVTRRRISGLVAAPIISSESSVLGASIRWERINDSRIQFYEVQVDDFNTFPNPTTFQVIETFFDVEALETTKFARVRAVRYDGLTGNYSNIATLEPTFNAPIVHAVQFYQEYTDDNEPVLGKEKRYSGEHAPKFYTLFEADFVPTKTSGSISVWGYGSCRIDTPKDSQVQLWDRMRFLVNNNVRFEQTFPHWTNAFGDEDTGPTLSDGTPVAFYGQGGFTAAFGPYGEPFPSTKRAEGPLDPTSVLAFYTVNFSQPWTEINSIRRPARWDTTPIATDQTLVDTSAATQQEAVVNLDVSQVSQVLKGRDFKFSIPSTAAITGVEAYIKRRQFLPGIPKITDDLGFASVIRNLSQTTSDVTADDVVAFNDFNGEMLDLSPASPSTELVRSTPLDNLGIANVWTLSLWFVPSENLFVPPPISNFRIIASFGSGLDNSGIQVYAMRSDGDPTPPPNTDGFGFFLGNTTGSNRWTSWFFGNIFNDLSLHHIVIQWTGSRSTIGTDSGVITYIDGVKTNALNVFDNSGGLVTQTDSGIPNGRPIRFLHSPSNTNHLTALLGQTALWNKLLTEDEVNRIFELEGRVDLRFNSGDYQSKDNLQHYWFLFPGPSDIRDHVVSLVDKNDKLASVQLGADNKAKTNETWPALSVFNTDGTADGVPHDSVVGIGYEKYGSDNDLWGLYLDPEDVNSFYFGLAIAGRNEPAGIAGPGFIDHMKMRIYYDDPNAVNKVNLKIQAEGVNNFYISRELFGAAFNGIEVSDAF